jgi:hypothetical protein
MTSRHFGLAFTLLPFLIGLTSPCAFSNSPAPLLQFRATELSSKNVIQFDLSQPHVPATVLVFLSARCPCSNSHEETLQNLSTKFPQFRFLGVHSNANEPEVEASTHFKNSPIQFPLLQDSDGTLANAFGALKTPHVYVVSPQGKILYQGGVDDSHDAKKATRAYLAQALQAIHDGKEPEVYQTRTLGCTIQRK